MVATDERGSEGRAATGERRWKLGRVKSSDLHYGICTFRRQVIARKVTGNDKSGSVTRGPRPGALISIKKCSQN